MFSKVKTLYCPVCSYCFGTFDMGKLNILHCEECKTKFFFQPGKEIPKSLLDSADRKRCKCLSCIDKS